MSRVWFGDDDEPPDGDFPAVMPDPETPILVNVRAAVPGTDLLVSLQLDEMHGLWVERPAAWSGFHTQRAERYPWLGGVATRERVVAPHTGAYDPDDLAYVDPVRAALQASRDGRSLNAKEIAACTRTWVAAWRDISGHLDQRASRMAAQFLYDAPLYSELANRPRVLDYVDACPALAPFLTLDGLAEVPDDGWPLHHFVAHVLGVDSVPSGFMAWARAMTWHPDTVPLWPRSFQDHRTALRAVVRNALLAGEAIDPNGIHKMTTAHEWLLLNLCLADRSKAGLVQPMLANPGAALSAVERFLPDGLNLPFRARAHWVLDVVRDWATSNREEAARASTFASFAKRARRWDQRMRAAEHDQEQNAARFRAAQAAAREEEARRRAEAAERLAEAARARGTHWTLAADIDPAAPFKGRPPRELVEDDQYVLEYIGTGERLANESMLMDHCVVSYAPKALAGSTQIYSVRASGADPASIPLATVSVASGGRITQARGPGNASLDPKLHEWIRTAVRTARRRTA